MEEKTSSAAEGGNQPRTYDIICNLPQAGQYPLRPDDMFCHAELLICATILQHCLSIAIVFLSF